MAPGIRSRFSGCNYWTTARDSARLGPMAVKRAIYARDEYIGDSALDVFSSRMYVVGRLLFDQSALAGYFDPPRYRAFQFSAAKGDALDIWVRSEDGDAVAWVLDTNYRTLAWNDDAYVGTTDAHIRLVIPASQPIFYIAFREFNFTFSHFWVTLKWRGRVRAAPFDRKQLA